MNGSASPREALERANRVKSQGKGRVAWYRGELYRDDLLEVASEPS